MHLSPKEPVFVTFTPASTSAGRECFDRLPERITREEAIYYVTVPHHRDDEPLEQHGGYQDVDDLLRRLDLDDYGAEYIAQVRRDLEHADLDQVVRDAYLSAEYRARDYFLAMARRTEASACPIAMPTYEERRAASWKDVEDYRREFPDKMAAELENAAFVRDHPEEVSLRIDEADRQFRERLEQFDAEAAQ